MSDHDQDPNTATVDAPPAPEAPSRPAERPSTRPSTRPAPAPPRLDRMPPWRVLLHDDDVNDMGYVVETILELTPLKRLDAVRRMFEAHHRGVSLLTITHREHAELLAEQFRTKLLTVTIEPADG